MARRKIAKPKTEKQPEKEIAAQDVNPGTAEVSAASGTEMAGGAQEPSDGAGTAPAGEVLHVVPGESQEGDGQAEETAAADAGAGEPAKTQPEDSSEAGNAGTVDVQPADLSVSAGPSGQDLGGVGAGSTLIEVNEPRSFEKQRLEIQAIQSTGTPENNRAIIDWTKGSDTPAYMDDHPERGKCLSINTLEGAHWVSVGDFVIRGIQGEFYPCKPDIFEASYRPVEDEAQTVFGLPDVFEPVTDDLALWAAYRGQQAVGRALGGDQDAPCLSFRQCELLVELLTKSSDASQSALEMQLKLNGAPLKLGDPLSATLLKVFRGAYVAVIQHLAAEALQVARAIRDKQAAEVSIPEHERALKLVPEALGLSETAKGR